MATEKDSDEYNMEHPKRGKAIIFNHKIFLEDKDDILNRIGADKDVENLQKCLELLEFDVIVYTNLKYNKIENTIAELAQENHSENDCILIVVMSHGMKNLIMASDGVYYPQNNLWEPFTADKCPTLAGKPKMFWIQACRGEGIDDGITLYKSSLIDSISNQVSDQIDSGANYSYKIPNMSDFLILNSTPPGLYSFRNRIEGSWLIQAVSKIFNTYCFEKDLLSMMTLIAREVAINFESDNPEEKEFHLKKQVPHITSTMIRHVYFRPKKSFPVAPEIIQN